MIEKTSPKGRIALLIEDNPQDIEIIQSALAEGNFRVNVANSARMAFNSIFKSPPDVIILDINLPDLDGFHVAKELKRNMMLRHIPLILLTSRIDFLEKMRSFDVIVDEYLVRPFNSKDLAVRTELVCQRVENNLDANPLTRLPGNIAIVKNIKSRLGKKSPYAVGYADLNNFKSYNDKYGFSKGDAVISFTAKAIVSAIQKLSPEDYFVGHVGGDDFIFTCAYESANEICQAIIALFDKDIPRFYNEEDRKKGYIMVEDRRGVISQFPLVSISIGMVSDEGSKFSNLGQINHSLTQLKKYAKSFQGSAYVRDRRNLNQQLAEFTWGPGSSAGNNKVLENIANALNSYMPGQLAEIMKQKAINILFQPIIDMEDDEVMGHESLVRGPAGTPLEFPDALFQTARNAGVVPELDMMCVKKVFDVMDEFRTGIKLFVNIFPETLLNNEILSNAILNDPRKHHTEIVFELSGANRATDPGQLHQVLLKLKTMGQKICLDASPAMKEQGLRYLTELKPDYIKMNMTQFRDMSADHKRYQEFLEVVNFIRQVGSKVICTKLESRADSFLALKAGVRFGQGFLFALPSLPLTSHKK